MNIKFKMTDKKTGLDFWGDNKIPVGKSGRLTNQFEIHPPLPWIDYAFRLSSGEHVTAESREGKRIRLEFHDGDVVAAKGLFPHDPDNNKEYEFAVSLERGKFIAICRNEHDDYDLVSWIEDSEFMRFLGNIYQPEHKAHRDRVEGLRGGWLP